MAVTILDVAKKARVSYTAVSDILNRGRAHKFSQATIDRVKKYADQLGYEVHHFAQSLKSGRANIIGIADPDGMIARRRDPYFSDIFLGAAEFFAQHDMKMVLYPFPKNGNGESNGDIPVGRMVDGFIFILLSLGLENFRKVHLKKMKRAGVPFVVISSLQDTMPYPNIGLDCWQGGYRAGEHLVKHHHYASVGFIRTDFQYQHHDNLLKGFKKALNDNDSSLSRQHYYTCEHHTAPAGYKLGNELLKKRKGLPRALVTVSDYLTMGLMQKLTEAGVRVPQDIALIGFGDYFDERQVYSKLTTIKQPGHIKGAAAAKMLLRMIKEPAIKVKPVVLDAELVIRKSCGCKRPVDN